MSQYASAQCGWISQFALECSMTIQLTRKSTFNFQQAIGFSVKLSLTHASHFYDSSHTYTHALSHLDVILWVYIHILNCCHFMFQQYILSKHANTSINFIEIDKVCASLLRGNGIRNSTTDESETYSAPFPTEAVTGPHIWSCTLRHTSAQTNAWLVCGLSSNLFHSTSLFLLLLCVPIAVCFLKHYHQ